VRPGDLWGLAARVVALAAAVALAVWVLVTALPLVLLLLLALILATGLAPLVEQLQQRTGLSRPLAVLVLYLVGLLVLLVLSVLAVPPVVQGIQQAAANAPQYPDQLAQRLGDLRRQFPFLPPLDQQAGGPLKDLGGQLGGTAGQALPAVGGVLGTAAGLLSAGLVLLFTTHFVVDGARMRDYLLSFLPPARRTPARAALDRMAQRMGAWLLGQVTLSLIMGVASFVGLSLLRIPDAVLLGLLGFVGEFIPMLGFLLSGLLAVLVALTQSPLQALATLVLYLVLQQLESNLLYPRIVGRAARLHPFALVLAVLLGSTWLGVVGTVLAVPVAAALAVILDEVRRAVAATSPSMISAGQAAPAEERRSAARPGATRPWWAFWRT
jgi:predicted PurR-regulated permease PerM